MSTKNTLFLTGTLLFAFAGTNAYAAVDQAGAMKLLKESKCLNCHDVSKTKKARSYKDIAAAYKGNPAAAAAVTKHITEPSQIVIDDEVVDHGNAKTKDPAKVKNLVEWILSR